MRRRDTSHALPVVLLTTGLLLLPSMLPDAYSLLSTPFFPELNAAEKSPSLGKGIDEYKAENYEEALSHLLKALSEGAEKAEATYYLGLTYKEMLVYEESRRFFEEAAKLAPENGEIQMNLSEVLFALERYDEAAEKANNASRMGVNRERILFVRGMIQSKKGNHGEAVKLFSDTAAEKGRLRQKALYQMGLSYLRSGDRSRAKINFEDAIAVKPESATAELARSGLTAIKSGGGYQPFKLSVGYAFQYDDNVTLEPSAGIPAGIQASDKQDTRHVFTFRGQYLSPEDRSFRYTTDYNFYQSLHDDLDNFDLQGHGVAFTPYFGTEQKKYYTAFGYDHFSLDGNSYLNMFTFRPSFRFASGERNFGTLFLSYQNKRYTDAAPLPDEERDGNNISAGFSYLVPGDGAGWSFNAGLTIDQEDTKGRNWDYLGGRINLSAARPLLSGVQLNLSGDYYLQDYRNMNTSYGEDREDKTLAIGAGLSYTRNWMRLNLTYAYTRVDSTLWVYEYRKNVFGIGISCFY